jgi:hypothetical protein
MESPPCSPDLVPKDLWLFPKIKSALKEFQAIEDIQKKKKYDDGTGSYSTTGVPKMLCFCLYQNRIDFHHPYVCGNLSATGVRRVVDLCGRLYRCSHWRAFLDGHVV